MSRTHDVAASRPAPWPLIALLGDPLDALADLRDDPHTHVFTDLLDVRGTHRAVVLGIDLRAHAQRRDARAVLRAVVDVCVQLARRLPSAEHILLLVHGHAGDEDDAVWHDADSATRRIRARIEQDCGRPVVVTAVLVAGCDDPARLTARLLARARDAEGLDAAATVSWEEIVDHDIGRVATNDYL